MKERLLENFENFEETVNESDEAFFIPFNVPELKVDEVYDNHLSQIDRKIWDFITDDVYRWGWELFYFKDGKFVYKGIEENFHPHFAIFYEHSADNSVNFLTNLYCPDLNSILLTKNFYALSFWRL